MLKSRTAALAVAVTAASVALALAGAFVRRFSVGETLLLLSLLSLVSLCVALLLKLGRDLAVSRQKTNELQQLVTRLSPRVSEIQRATHGIRATTDSLPMLRHLYVASSSYRAVSEGRPRVLLVSSNGAGLGHLSRLLAIKAELDADTRILTMSDAWRRVPNDFGPLDYFPSAGRMGVHPREWNLVFARFLQAFIGEFRPDSLVFDGTYVHEALTTVCRANGVRLVWLQRGCWKAEIDNSSAQRPAAVHVCDMVLIPDDYGCQETVDSGSNVRQITVAPITLVQPSELLMAAEARAELGLPEGNLVLLQLGAGTINDIAEARAAATEAVLALGDGWIPVIVENPLNPTTPPDNASMIAGYPLARYFEAFEFGVFAGGYNAIQESLALGLPGVFIPNDSTVTDDQRRRVRTITNLGLGHEATTTEDLIRAVNILSDPVQRAEMKTRMASLPSACGASEAADAIVEECRTSRMARPFISSVGGEERSRG